MLTLAIFSVLLILLMIDVPIAVAIGFTAVAFFIGQGQSSFLAMLPQRMYFGTTGCTLLAIPFFILAGRGEQHQLLVAVGEVDPDEVIVLGQVV